MEGFLAAVDEFLSNGNLDLLSGEQRDWIRRQYTLLKTLHTSMFVVYRRFHEAFTTIFFAESPMSPPTFPAFRLCWLLFLNAQGTHSHPCHRTTG